MLNLTASASDRGRDAAIPLLEGVACHCNIPYRPGLLLDVYYPEGTQAPLPTIVSIHGGGYVYGSKESYRRYGMDLVCRGFAFVNFNYQPPRSTDFLREHAQPMYDFLAANGILAEMRCYESEDDKTVAYVFHISIYLPDAIRCNDETCAFLRSLCPDLFGVGTKQKPFSAVWRRAASYYIINHTDPLS